MRMKPLLFTVVRREQMEEKKEGDYLALCNERLNANDGDLVMMDNLIRALDTEIESATTSNILPAIWLVILGQAIRLNSWMTSLVRSSWQQIIGFRT